MTTAGLARLSHAKVRMTMAALTRLSHAKFAVNSSIVALAALAFTASLKVRADSTPTASIDANGIIGIEAIVAAQSNGAFYSRFGHAMLRLVKADGNFATDPVLSLEADVPANQVDAVKGLDGAYRVVPDLETFGNRWLDYVSVEERPLQRIIIPTTPAMRARLLETLVKWINDPSAAGNYTFLRNNCVGALSKLFEESGFPSPPGRINPIIPTNLNGWLSASLLSLYPTLEMDSPKSLYDQAAAMLKISTADFTAGKNWPPNSAEILNAGLSDLDIKRILLNLPLVPETARDGLAKAHNFSSGANLDQAMAYVPVPPSLYQTCADSSCAAEVAAELNQIWSADSVQSAVDQDRFAYATAVRYNFVGSSGDDGYSGGSDSVTYTEPLSQVVPSLAKAPDLIRSVQLFLQTESSIP
jgi:hypothetical protein